MNKYLFRQKNIYVYIIKMDKYSSQKRYLKKNAFYVNMYNKIKKINESIEFMKNNNVIEMMGEYNRILTEKTKIYKDKKPNLSEEEIKKCEEEIIDIFDVLDNTKKSYVKIVKEFSQLKIC